MTPNFSVRRFDKNLLGGLGIQAVVEFQMIFKRLEVAKWI